MSACVCVSVSGRILLLVRLLGWEGLGIVTLSFNCSSMHSFVLLRYKGWIYSTYGQAPSDCYCSLINGAITDQSHDNDKADTAELDDKKAPHKNHRAIRMEPSGPRYYCKLRSFMSLDLGIIDL